MQRIKRTKGGQTAWVTGIAIEGSVSGLSPDASKAALLTDEQAEAVKSFYSGRPIAGNFVAVPWTEKDQAAADAAANKHRADEQAEIELLKEENAQLRTQLLTMKAKLIPPGADAPPKPKTETPSADKK